MKLDELLGKLITEKEGKRKISRKYNSRTFVDVVERLEELNSVNTLSEDGVRKYQSITGDDTSAYTREEIELRRKARYIGGNKDLSEYIHEHLGGIIDDLSEDDTIKLSFTYCPTKRIKGASQSFKDAADVVKRAKTEITEMQSDPDKYFENKLKNETGIMKYYMASFKDEYFKIQQQKAQNLAVEAIKKYEEKNKGKFLRNVREHMERQNESLEKERERFNDHATELQQKSLSVKEFARRIRRSREDLEDAFEDYADGQALKDFIRNTATAAMNEIRKKNGYEPVKIELAKIVGDRYDIDPEIVKGEKLTKKKK